MTSQHTTQAKTDQSAQRTAQAPVTQASTMQTHPILHLQRKVGNQATAQMIQAKLTVGEPNDMYEQEADRVAAAVVRKLHAPTQSTAQRQPQASPLPQIQPLVQRKADMDGMAVSANVEAGIQQARGSGQPLPESLRNPMEQAFGADFSGVRVHSDGESDRLNRAMQARAFTTGQDIFFQQGAYQTNSRTGQELVAHELTHVVQQNCQTFFIQRQITAQELLKHFDIGTYGTAKNTCFDDDQEDEILKSEAFIKRAEFLANIASEFEEGSTPEVVNSNNQKINLPISGLKRIQFIKNIAIGLSSDLTDEKIIERAVLFCRRQGIIPPVKYRHIKELSEKEIRNFQDFLTENRKDINMDDMKVLNKIGLAMPQEFPQITWVGSGLNSEKTALEVDKGEKGVNHFAKWINALIGNKDEKDLAPKKETPYKMNCWEGVMYTAYQAKLIDEQWLKDVHKKAVQSKENYFNSLAESLGFSRAVPYTPSKKIVPEPGDIVFFDKMEHVALALSEGRIMHLWHNTIESGQGFEITTFEDLFRNMPSFRVETKFAPNPFKYKIASL
jgi:hypothetical protein